MKGIVFTYLEEFVANNHGIEAWDTMLDTTELRTEDGVYVAPGNYPSSDLMALVQTASNMTNTPIPELVFTFGKFVASKFHEDYTHFFKDGLTAKSFIMQVDKIIHVEVKKLYPDVVLPEISYEDTEKNKLIMNYSSRRNLCDLARGLITGVAEAYGENVIINETACSKQGAQACRLELSFIN